MSFQYSSPGVGGGVSGNTLEWAIQGALDDIDPGVGNFIIPIGSMITGYGATLTELDPYSWRSVDTLTVPIGRAGWYLITLGLDHPAAAIGAGVQESLNDFNVGIEIAGQMQKYSADSNAGLPEVGGFAIPAYLNVGNTVKFMLNADENRSNEDFLIRASIINLR